MGRMESILKSHITCPKVNLIKLPTGNLNKMGMIGREILMSVD